jgi:hypothetical protein
MQLVATMYCKNHSILYYKYLLSMTNDLYGYFFFLPIVMHCLKLYL